jgi:hypothetical protein
MSAQQRCKMADVETAGRRVYVLPAELIERIRAYQSDNGLSSEVEAVRRLLDIALQLRDTSVDLLARLRSKFETEKDLRMLVRDNLAAHALVRTVTFEDGAIEFSLNNGDRGRMEKSGETYIIDGNGDLQREPRVTSRRQSIKMATPSWDAPKGGSDLDDEIPF